jgi:hypothetical protein
MKAEEKVNIVTKKLLLDKDKCSLELERFINSDIPIEQLTEQITDKLNDYRDSIANIQLWLEFMEPNNNSEEGENNTNK